MKIQALAAGVFLGAVTLAYGVGWVNGHAVSSTGGGAYLPPRAQSSSPSARSLVTGGGDMANGSPAALSSDWARFELALGESIRISGGDGGGQGLGDVRAPAPASTTVVQAQESGTEAPRLPPVATVIISAMTPTATTASKPASTTTDSLEAQVRAAVVAYFPASQVETAMRVAYCESRYQPWAAEPGGHHFGIFQVDPSIHGAVPSDIDGQVRQAAALVAHYGWGPWSCR